MHPPIPFAAQNGTGLKLRALLAPCHGTLASLFRRFRAIEQALALGVEVAPMIRLQAIGQNTEQQMTGEVRGRWSPPDCVPTAAKPADVEIAQARNLDVKCLAVRRRRTDPHAGMGLDGPACGLPGMSLGVRFESLCAHNHFNSLG